MIDRPLYLNKNNALCRYSLCEDSNRSKTLWKINNFKNDYEKLKEERNIVDEQILNYRFDSMEYEDMTTKELYLELKSKYYKIKMYLFLDEIQEIEGWEMLLILPADFDVDIYIKGSNSRMMSSEISTYLTGRYITFHIYLYPLKNI